MLFVPAGEHIVGASTTGVCGGGLREALVTIAAGQRRAYRVGSGAAMDFFLLPTAVD